MDDFLETVRQLGEPSRFRIFKILQERPAYVCEIAHVLGLKMATISGHLMRLRHAGIIGDKREGNKILYFLIEPKTEEKKVLVDFLKKVGNNWKQIKEDKAKLKEIKLNDVCPGS